MSLPYLLLKIKPYYSVFIFVALASLFFALGRYSAISKQEGGIQIDNTGVYVSHSGGGETKDQTGAVIESIPKKSTTTISSTNTTSASSTPSGEVIGSKSGKKYYFPWCGTVKRIKPENQVHFESIEAAKAAGFTPGGNCKGLY